mmetsp:Transcript_6408/g.10760  ORF Transcript_6408/g.10760 Transcript_6408/m.10760 type:complete len:346 (+) Transcript_6408:112-1149(+)
MKFLKKSKVAEAPNAPTDGDSLDVVIEINQKTPSSEAVEAEVAKAEVAEEAVCETAKEEVSPEPTVEASEQTEVEEAAAEDAPTQEASKETRSKFKFWKSAKEEKKEEEPVEEESQEQEKEEPVVEKEEAAPAAEAEAEAEAEVAPAQAAPAEEAKAEEANAEAETAEKGEFCGSLNFLQAKFAFWQKKAAEKEDEGEEVENEAEEKHFTQTVEILFDGVAIQTLRLTNAGMEGLNNFMASVQDESHQKGESISKTWLAEQLSKFFGTAMVEGDAVVELPSSAPEEAPASTPVEEEKAEVETQPATKGRWWPFSSAKTEEKALDDGRNETAEGEVDAEQAREVAA